MSRLAYYESAVPPPSRALPLVFQWILGFRCAPPQALCYRRASRAQGKQSLFLLLVRGQFCCLLGNVLLRPFIITASLTGLGALRSLHLLHQIHVRGKIAEALPDDLLN